MAYSKTMTFAARSKGMTIAIGMVFSILRAYIDRAAGLQNDAFLTGVHHIYSIRVFKVVSQYNGQKWSATELEKLRNDVHALKDNILSLFSLVCIYGLLKLKFHFLDQLIVKISRFGGISEMGALPYKQLQTIVKAEYCHRSKRRATHMYERVSVLHQMLTNAP